MFTISREYWFSAAHRIEGHPKCGRLHGHNYRVVVELTSEQLDSATGMVLDYGVLDTIVKPIVDSIDHKYIVSDANLVADDPYVDIATDRGDAIWLPIKHSTAECLADFLKLLVFKELPQFKICVRVDETPRSSAYA